MNKKFKLWRVRGRGRQVGRSVVILMLALLLGRVSWADKGIPGQGAGAAPPAEACPHTLLVGFKAGTRGTIRANTHAVLGAQRANSFKYIPVDVVRVSGGADLGAVMAAYRRLPDVEFVEPNYIIRLDALPDDAMFGSLWGLRNTGQSGGTPGADIAVTGVWDVTTGSADVVVAVIDTGIDYNHPDLVDNIWVNPSPTFGDLYGASWLNTNGVPTSGDPMDDHGHGTHVAGTIGAVGNNGVGVAGVNWTVKLMGLKFLNSAGSGSIADAIAAIEYAIEKGAHLSNNSWGGGEYTIALRNVIAAAEAAGQLFVAAAGNSGTDNDVYPHYPSSYDVGNVLAVASSDRRDFRSDFSCYGRTSVHLAAPGSAILSTWPGNEYNSISGTSMAAPHVAGVAALLLSLYPDATPAQLKSWIMQGARKRPAWTMITFTEGRLDAAETFRIAGLGANVLPVTGFTAAAGAGSDALALTWTLPVAAGLEGVRVSRGVNVYPSHPDEGVTVYAGLAAGFTDSDLPMHTRYYYTIWAVYTGGVCSPAAYARARVGGEATDDFTEDFAAGGNDLAYRYVYFIPDGSVNYYSAYSGTATAFPSDPAGGTMLNLGLDGYQMVALSAGAQVSLYGISSSYFYVGANGYITLGTGDTSYTPSPANHFNLPRISGLFCDLDSQYQGMVSSRQFPDRVVVTYYNVPLFYIGGSNNFQIEMFFDGSIRITWLGLSTSGGLAGLSAGEGVPPGFVNSDLTGYELWRESIIRLSGDLAFGQVLAGGVPQQRAMTVHNDGDAPFLVSSISYPQGFSGNWNAGVVAAGGAREVVVAFHPDQLGEYGGRITVNADAHSGVNILTCSGQGVAIQAPVGLTASSGDYSDRIALSWSTGLGALSYRVWRSTSSANWDNAELLAETGACLYDDTGAAPGRTYYYRVQSRNIGVLSVLGPVASGWRRSSAVSRNVAGDFDGDGFMDLVLYREATGEWLLGLSGRGYAVESRWLGGPGWQPVAGDYDGDGLTDLAVYARATGDWQVLLSGSGQLAAGNLGGPGWQPVTGDYDGDGATDPGVYHAASGMWQVILSGSGYAGASLLLGGPGFMAVPADYDGDGRTDPAVFQQQDFAAGWQMGYWQARLSGSSYRSAAGSFGDRGHQPVPADYNGDWQDDPATYSRTDGRWFISSLGAGPLVPSVRLGGEGWTPVPADYDGDGQADPVVYHEATGMWQARLSGDGYNVLYHARLGGPGYIPVTP